MSLSGIVRRRRLLALGLVLLAGCRVAPVATPATKTSASPHADASASASVAPGGPQGLKKPASGTRTLAGTVNIDASYLVSNGGRVAQVGGQQTALAAGPLIGQDGNGLIGQDGNGLIGQDGNNLIGQDGNGLIGQDGNGLIGQDGNGLIGQDGNGLIGQDGNGLVAMADDGSSFLAAGAGIVAQGGGNIVAQGGGNIVAQGGGNAVHTYQLAAATPVALGTKLPAAGMLVSVVSLDKHTYVPLGVDAAGKPVYSVYSAAGGHFQVYVPTSYGDNVAVVASPPGLKKAELALNVLSTGQAANSQLDDARSAATRLLRRALVAQLSKLFLDDGGISSVPCDPSAVLLTFIDPKLEPELLNAGHAALAKHHNNFDELDQDIQRAADFLLSKIDLDNLDSHPEFIAKEHLKVPGAAPAEGASSASTIDVPQAERAIPALAEIMLKIQAGAGKALSDPAFFTCPGTGKPSEAFCTAMVASGLAKDTYVTPLDIKLQANTPYDLTTFIVDIMLGRANGHVADRLPQLLELCGYSPAEAQTEYVRILACATGAELEMLTHMKGENADPAIRVRFLELIAGGAVVPPLADRPATAGPGCTLP